MAEPSKAAARPHRHALMIPRMAIIALVVIVLVIAGAYLGLSGGAARIGTSTAVTLTSSPSYFSIGSGVYSLSLARAGSGGTAYIYVNRLPIFVNPLLNVTLVQDNTTKVNAGSSFASIGFMLESAGNSSMVVRITPLDPNLQIAPDAGRIRVVSVLLAANNGGASTTSYITTTAVTTTIAATTTIAQTNTTHANIMTALKRYNVYGLMQNYSILYANTSQCTPIAYHNAYTLHYSYQPMVPNDYQNVSTVTPYALYTNTTNIGKGNYSFAYSTKTIDSVYNNTHVVVMKINVSTSRVYNTVFTGIFQGQNYTSLLIGYSKAQGIGGPCGVVVP